MTELFRIRLDEAIAEVERELSIRRTFYPQRVRDRRMSRITADDQIGRLEAARDFLIEYRMLKGGRHEHTPRGQRTLAG